MEILNPLSLYVLVFLGLYAIAKVSDLLIREAQVYLWDGSPESLFFLAEVVLGIFVPFAMLVSHRVRSSPLWLGVASALVVFGVFINRVNVFITAYQSPFAPDRYIPSLSEVVITIGLVAVFMFLHRVALFVLPIPSVSGEYSRSVREEAHQTRHAHGEDRGGAASSPGLKGRRAQQSEA
jgi:Ni/Fe-hydrogenase subunit HybB-like protein